MVYSRKVPTVLALGESALQGELNSLLVIALIAAAAPIVIGLLRLKIAEVVVLLGAGVIVGPHVLDLVQVDSAITLLSELGLGFLFFAAGLELDQRAVKGRSGRLAAIGWGVSALLAAVAALVLERVGVVQDALGVAIALTSTALGTLLPILRDSGELKTPFGKFFMGAGALGEFGPILAMSVLLSTVSPWLAIVSLVMFLSIAAVFARAPLWLQHNRLMDLIQRHHLTSAQTAVRLTMLLLVALLAIAEDFGLDVILGAFIAGVIVRRYSPAEEESRLQSKVDGLAFGFFVPIFFIVSGANLDIVSIIERPLPLVLFFVLLVIVRGLPQFLLYRRVIPDRRQRTRFALLVATGLPIIVAVTSLEVAAGVMKPQTAASLVGAGALSVLVFPLIATLMRRKGAQDERISATV